MALLLLTGAGPDAAGQTALDSYVATPDPSFTWSLHSTMPGAGYTGYVLDMTSQSWRTADEVDYPEWQHWVTVIVPDAAPPETAVLFIDGGSRSATPEVASEVGLLATMMNAITVHVPTVPNQSLEFFGDGVHRKEDEIIAYTFDKYLNGGDDSWPALLPMVKSAVGAMDATQQFEATQGVNEFVVMGASKRGWTTWLTGAYDAFLDDPANRRVKAIVPWVIDVLNMDEQMPHHKAAYEGVTEHIHGGYSEEVEDYVDFNVFDRLGTSEGQALLEIVDPYEYRDRYAEIPKYLINATGDEFFVPDSAQFYFDDLPGEKYLRYIPNTGHGGSALVVFDALQGITSFYEAVLAGADLPEFSWTVEDEGRKIRVMVDSLGDASGVEVKLWQATNPDSRDFRWYEGTGPFWTDTILTDLGGGEYLGGVEFPETGATAFMVELTFDREGPTDPSYVFTTQVSVVVPEPSTMLLAALGSLALLVYGWPRRASWRRA